MTSSVKVHFRITQDEDGYPPVAVESLWAQPQENADEYLIDNVPFFGRSVTIGDTVLVRHEDGHRYFDRIVRRSENSLVRVVFFDPGCRGEVDRYLCGLGCSTEYLNAHKLLAVNVPANVDMAEIRLCLDAQAGAGTLDYEEPILRQ